MWFTEWYVDKGGFPPERAHKTDAGIDIKTPVDIFINPNDCATVDTKLHVFIPEGYVGLVKSKSGLNIHDSILTTGVIDAGYTGTIVVKLYSHDKEVYLSRGDKIAQLVIVPVQLSPLKEISPERFEREAQRISSRGKGGFGSTGK